MIQGGPRLKRSKNSPDYNYFIFMSTVLTVIAYFSIIEFLLEGVFKVQVEIGDLAVYPAHGVGRIESMERRPVGNAVCDVFVMRILENDMRITIPAQNLDEIGLRPLIKKNQVKKVYDVFKKPTKAVSSVNWNRRHRDYMERVKTGSPFEVAAVMGELLAMRADKELSFGERKLLDMVKTLLIKELALAAEKSEDVIDAEILAFFPPPKGAGALTAL
jgi:CarD family transcriptional regulator